MSLGEVVAAAAAGRYASHGYLATDSVYSIVRQFIGTSAGSTVAIDNKIEQAMDLVKSHLMFAVREEVDVLKEKITELLDRISQLEYENGILRAGATPETLSLLSQPAQPQQASQQASQQPMVLPQPVLAQPQVLAQPVTIQQTAATQPQQAAAVAAPTLQQQQQSLQQQPT